MTTTAMQAEVESSATTLAFRRIASSSRAYVCSAVSSGRKFSIESLSAVNFSWVNTLDLSTAMASVSAALQAASQLATLATAKGNVEMREAIAELRLQLATTKDTLSELINENRELRQQLSQRSAVPNVALRDGLYYKEDGDGPFCTQCFDSGQTLIRVSAMPSVMNVFGKWRCPKCTAKFT